LLQGYGYIALFLLLSLAFAGLMLTLPLLLRKFKVIPHKPSAVKSTTVECGLETTGRSWVQFNPHYYFFALIAVVLDVMLVFILPWAVGLKNMGWYALATGAIFVAILLVGYIYAWRKGVLQWR
jgi:NADH-quinone oxidoreductase subunit A